MPFRCLFHMHTRFSFDSWLSPRTILARAREREVDVLIATDHNTLRGARELKRIAEGTPPFIVIAGEYQTEKGDIIGLFLQEEITTRRSNEMIRQIRQQGGLVVLPHPFQDHTPDHELLAHVDLIETYNSRCSVLENEAAEQLARKLQKPGIAGCDAHCAGELGAAVNQFSAALPSSEQALRQSLLEDPRCFVVCRVSCVYRPYSQMIKAIKTRNPVLLLSQTKRLATCVIRETLRRHG